MYARYHLSDIDSQPFMVQRSYYVLYTENHLFKRHIINTNQIVSFSYKMFMWQIVSDENYNVIKISLILYRY